MNAQLILSYLKKQYPKTSIRHIGSGWTSNAFEVGNKIIRVSKIDTAQYIKEVNVLDFLQGKLSIQIPHPQLVYEPFFYAIHTKIEGFSWNIETFNHLNSFQQDAFSRDIALFFHELHSISIHDIFKVIPPKMLNSATLDSLDIFKYYLSKYFSHSDIKLLYEWTISTLQLNDAPVLLHKDFWEANTLVDSQHRLVGVFDWANACVGNPEWDFRTLYHPDYFHLLDKIIHFYNELSGIKLSLKQIENLVWADSLFCIQYFCQNPQMIKSNPKGWQDSLLKVQNSLDYLNSAFHSSKL